MTDATEPAETVTQDAGAELPAPAPPATNAAAQPLPQVPCVFTDAGTFELAQRAAKALAASTLVPRSFRGPEGVANCLVALEMATRVGASPLAVMQNMHVIEGRPSWSAQFIIGALNSCGRFEPIAFRMIGEPGTETYGCVCTAVVRATGEIAEGPAVTMRQGSQGATNGL